jgi:hypothetical protein
MLSVSGNTGRAPKPGDQRILVSRVKGEVRAVHYEQRSNRRGHAAEIASPNRSVAFDYIADVSRDVRLAEGRVPVAFADSNVVFRKGVELRRGFAYELAIPLSLLSLRTAGTVTGDIGVLLGNGTTTTRRLYWSDKNTAMLFDAPEESLLRPALWGELRIAPRSAEASSGQRPVSAVVATRGDRVDLMIDGRGGLDITSTHVGSGRPAATVNWSGKGTLTSRGIGRGGYIIFRHRAQQPLVPSPPLSKLAEPFTFKVVTPGRFKDGLYAAARPRMLKLSLDGAPCTTSAGMVGGALWSGQKTRQTATWEFHATDAETHQLTVMIGSAARSRLLLTSLPPQDERELLGEEESSPPRELVSFDGTEGMAVVQFNFTGSVHLTLEQPPYSNEDIKNRRAAANITAIFLD